MSLLRSHQQGITWLTLNRPEKHNALHPDLIHRLLREIQTARLDEATRVLGIKAQGVHFSAGADLVHMQHMATVSVEDNTEDAAQLATLLHTLYQFPKPTLVQVQGATYGGGLGLIAACDIAIAETNATFCFSEVRLGLIPAVISPFIIAAMGRRAAQAWFLSAAHFTAERAQALGLIHQHVTLEKLSATVEKQAERLASFPTEALQACKSLTHTVAAYDPQDADQLIPLTAELLAKQRSTPAAKIALAKR